MAFTRPVGRSVVPCIGMGMERQPFFIMMWWLPEIRSNAHPYSSRRFFNCLPFIAYYYTAYMMHVKAIGMELFKLAPNATPLF